MEKYKINLIFKVNGDLNDLIAKSIIEIMQNDD